MLREFISKVIQESEYQDAALDKINQLGGFKNLPDIDKLALLSDTDNYNELKKLNLIDIYKQNGGTFGHLMIKVKIKPKNEQSIQHKMSQENAGKVAWLFSYIHYTDKKEPYVTVQFDEFNPDYKAYGGGQYERANIMLDNLFPIGYDEIKSDFVDYQRKADFERDEFKKFFDSDEQGISEQDDNNYSSVMGVQPYKQRKQEFLNSLKSFKNIEDREIKQIFDFFGTEGYNDEEEAFEDFKEKIEDYKKMPDPVKLYRVVGVKDEKLIKTDDLGEHYTLYEWNLDGDMLMSIGYENWDEDVEPYVMEVLVPHSEIDVVQTIIQNLSFPNEHEINLKNKGRGAKLLRVYKLD